MRKLIKKIAVYVSAFALAAAGIVAGKADAVKAAEIETTVHVVVKGAPEGTDKIGFNIWGGAWVVSDDWVNLATATTALSEWGWGETWAGNIDMTQDANGMYTCTMKYDQDQFDGAGGNHGMQVFVYGANNAAVAADYSSTLHELLADESLSDIYIIADYTNVEGAVGGVVTIQKDAPSTDTPADDDDKNNTPADDDDKNNTPADDDKNNTPADDDDSKKGEDVTTGDASSMIMLIAVAAVAAATVVITRKKSVEE